jgi:hypothetical protein
VIEGFADKNYGGAAMEGFADKNSGGPAMEGFADKNSGRRSQLRGEKLMDKKKPSCMEESFLNN